MSFLYISRFIYSTFYQNTTKDARKTLTRVRNKNGLDVLRQLQELCDPLALIMILVKVKDIAMPAKAQYNTPDQLVTVIESLKKKVDKYEEKYRDAGTGTLRFHASTILSNADFETWKHLLAQGTGGDFDKMLTAAEQLKKATRALKENDDRAQVMIRSSLKRQEKGGIKQKAP